MPTIDEMDEYVNWDHAADGPYPLDLSVQDINNDPNHSMDLAFEGIVDDDFGFFALQHFSGEQALLDRSAITGADSAAIPAWDGVLPDTLLSPQECWETPASPCEYCAAGGYLCKLIREGKFKGYCTSCVALGHECSLAGAASVSPPEPTPPIPTTCVRSQPEPTNFVATEDPRNIFLSSSASDLQAMFARVPEPTPVMMATPPPAKIGARLSRESIRILRQWLSTHTRHPYPSDEEKDMLQRQTGLTKTQITNWLANARRRGKIQPPRSTSPHVRNLSGPLDIPPRRGTPALESMNPLQRWVDSPPEHEPASAIAIARAVTASTVTSSGQASPFSHIYTDDGSGRSIQGSSASSVGTSHSSGGSFASAYSHASRGSFGSFGSFGRGRRRRRRRNAPKKVEEKTSLATPLKTYQCTFCTETFKTKHDWQRHEKSLHLSLERWVCCTHGPKVVKPDINMLACVFCGEPNPTDEHIETHNFSSCQDKNIEGRTFYRKDHLNQHLRLVHNVKFIDWSMKNWKVATPEIRSRCGFCGIVMDTWSIRVDHLAEHFKTGYSMADWKGDWGFDAPVLELVENSIPPYLIHNERQTPFPFAASKSPAETPRNAYELIKLELAYFMDRAKKDEVPSDDQLQVEACRIIFASEMLSLQGISSTVSWLRDLIMSSEDITRQAKFAPLRSQAENRLAVLKINGKDNLFEACPLEADLREFVRSKMLLGLTAMDNELQVEACKIVGRMEEVSTHPSGRVANWLVRLINSSTKWLAPFRQRAHLPRSEDLADTGLRPTDPKTIDSTVYNYCRLERELRLYLEQQRSAGVEPADADLQRQARIILYELEDGWNQTAADNAEWLAAFKERHSVEQSTTQPKPAGQQALPSPASSLPSLRKQRNSDLYRFRKPHFSLGDANCYRRLIFELGRYVASAMSANNPNQHVPSDEELKHQARWILYDDDDPWNQTAADNEEWLQRFKRDAGIIRDEGPGLPAGDSWSPQQGGTSFAPPCAYPKSGAVAFGDPVHMSLRDGARSYEMAPATANQYLETLTTRCPRPARVFCSRELEEGLADFVRRCRSAQQVGGGGGGGDGGALPSDAALRERARGILGTDVTPADDDTLLGKFKDMMKVEGAAAMAAAESSSAAPGAATATVTAGGGPTIVAPVPVSASQAAAVAGAGPNLADMRVDQISDEDLDNILKDMDFEFDCDVQDALMGGGNASTF